MLNNKRPSPTFSFVLPKNGNYDSAKRVAQEMVFCVKYLMIVVR